MIPEFLIVHEYNGKWAIAIIRSYAPPKIVQLFDTEEEARKALKETRPPVWIGR